MDNISNGYDSDKTTDSTKAKTTIVMNGYRLHCKI